MIDKRDERIWRIPFIYIARAINFGKSVSKGTVLGSFGCFLQTKAQFYRPSFQKIQKSCVDT